MVTLAGSAGCLLGKLTSSERWEERGPVPAASLGEGVSPGPLAALPHPICPGAQRAQSWEARVRSTYPQSAWAEVTPVIPLSYPRRRGGDTDTLEDPDRAQFPVCNTHRSTRQGTAATIAPSRPPGLGITNFTAKGPGRQSGVVIGPLGSGARSSLPAPQPQPESPQPFQLRLP